MLAETESPEETEAAAAALAQGLGPGDIVLVAGELGAGKTTFVRGACRALGVTEAVTSPTFTIGQVYAAAGPVAEVAHLDLYRVAALSDEEPGLLEDYLTPERIGFVEWPGIAEGTIGRPAVQVTIAHAGGDRRTIRIS